MCWAMESTLRMLFFPGLLLLEIAGVCDCDAAPTETPSCVLGDCDTREEQSQHMFMLQSMMSAKKGYMRAIPKLTGQVREELVGKIDLQSCFEGSYTANQKCKEVKKPQCELGRPVNFAAFGKEHLKPKCRAHRFSFSLGNEEALMCVPQKNGNNNFAGLIYYQRHGKVPAPGTNIPSSRPVKSCSRILWIARDPYSRLLSLYLEKVERTCLQGECSSDTNSLFQTLTAEFGRAPDSFEEFTTFLSTMVNNSADELCKLNHHLCTQVSGCLFSGAAEVRVLKLEEMDSWYPCLAQEMGLSREDLVGDRWSEFSGQPCFYAQNGDCSFSSKNASVHSEAVGRIDNIHGTGASSKISEHYTEKAARFVNSLYRHDFDVLQYPIWDGESTFPML
eukprot:TRINITY_DN42644_c0_g1_i1.p1 TRINITY_DN42644_c0_g1~~TRINITY_DN42644_c0_g1_i1.p1  ORF type:complete len:391 (+),score=54.29 TRINITY_DN42644_c0_g1_i1:41-1213(+)